MLSQWFQCKNLTCESLTCVVYSLLLLFSRKFQHGCMLQPFSEQAWQNNLQNFVSIGESFWSRSQKEEIRGWYTEQDD